MTLTAVLLASVGLNVAGTVALKSAAQSSSAVVSAVGCGFYVAGAALYVLLLQHRSLAMMAVVTSMLGLTTIILVGVWLFGERLALTQWLGVVLALMSVFLTAWPSLSD